MDGFQSDNVNSYLSAWSKADRGLLVFVFLRKAIEQLEPIFAKWHLCKQRP